VPRFHHVNLGVPVDGVDSQSAFLIDVLGFRSIGPGDDAATRGAIWFEGEDGGQIHLSVDPEHRPAARAHVAVVLDNLTDVEDRLRATGVNCSANETNGRKVVLCRDPAGNRWELRSS
jgi:catechol 2,3-dioxygenase-like lactoylglutathione lyase family enzyme